MMVGSYVVLSVSDTGIGMTAETMSHIFEPFFTTKEHGKGTGLGLSTVYGIVKQSGGAIWVYSEPGQGTTFKVYFPRVDHEVELSGPAELSDTRSAGTETLLIAEDDPVVRMTVCHTLRARGYSVLETSDGVQAAAASAAHRGDIDLLLTDVVMPRMGGAELAERLLRERPGLKVLYMSAHLDEALVHRGILDDASAFLEKPFTRDQLLQKIRNVLEPGR
jgi:CheY-like chemotaxis protein